ncbi:hypothetical protein T07_8243 [Trichinella nelsoni]|uniref:Uncharacterized protein n=1 Tax=Trichinella nelsoni TaxID=6336 RepID=A0A0V0RT01_9BILA|nr:hypothetical protein T07_8243 [Trichinella nelsoni]
MEPNMQYNSNSLPCACSILFLIGDCVSEKEKQKNYYLTDELIALLSFFDKWRNMMEIFTLRIRQSSNVKSDHSKFFKVSI